MNILQTEWWMLAVPPEWWAEREEDSILVGDRDEVGVIEISTLRREQGEFTLDELRAIAQDNAPEGAILESLGAGDFEGFACSFEEDDAALREWYVAAADVLLFITYSCDLDNAGMDDAAVDEILDTLLLSPAAEVS